MLNLKPDKIYISSANVDMRRGLFDGYKQQAVDEYNQEQKARYNAQQAEKCERISKYSLDEENKRIYKARAEQWREKENSYKSVANSGESGIIKIRKFNSKADPMYEVTGSAFSSNPKEVQQMIDTLKEWGVEVNYGSSTLGYGCSRRGYAGVMSVTKEASFSAWCHEFQHVKDDKEAGWNGVEVLWFNPKERERRERRAYAVEIQLARKAGRKDIVKRLEENLNEEIKKIYSEFKE